MTKDEIAQIVKAASRKMRADDNTKGTLRYLEHISWLLFLRTHETIEDEAEEAARIDGVPYRRVIDGDLRWSEWTRSGRTGDELISFVREVLLPGLRELSESDHARRIARIFEGVRTVMRSGYVLADVVDLIDQIEFHAVEDYHTMSVLYETLLAQLGREAGWSGEIYTPRPIVEFMVTFVDPLISESVYDPAAGSGGFLVAAFEHLREQAQTTADHEALQAERIYGQEAGELPYLLGTMNLILHGIRNPNLVRVNTLEEDVRAIPSSERHDIVLTNPPFGGSEQPEVQHNFPLASAATEVLFLQHIIAKLKRGGRAGVVVPDSLLSNSSFDPVKRRLLTESNLHTIVSLPQGTFAPYSDVKTSIAFFERGRPTESIWYYETQLRSGSRLSKTRPITREHFDPIWTLASDRLATEASWVVDIALDSMEVLDLTPRNPSVSVRRAISAESVADTIAERLQEIREGLFATEWDPPLGSQSGWDAVPIGRVLTDSQSGFACAKRNAVEEGVLHIRPYNISLHGELTLEEQLHLPEELVDLGKYYVQPGDVLFNNTNSAELVGKAAVVDEPMRAAFSNHITRLRVDRTQVTPEWLLLCLRALHQDGYFLRNCKRWIGQAGFNATKLEGVVIPVPDLSIQEALSLWVEESSSARRRGLRAVSETLEELDRLSEAIAGSALRPWYEQQE